MGVRAGAALAALAVVALVGCTGGDGGGRSGGGATTTRDSPSTTLASTSTTVAPTTTAGLTGDPTGTVTLHATGFVLPAGGSGLRMLARPAGQRVTVRRQGGGGAVSACPAIDVAGPAGPGGCAPLEDGHPL